ncbi:ATP-binding protein [Pseudonocardia halophobica]|uniref:Nuclease SbcCD subunit C n=1 Tax=Pseudonocardia halophobica TaxID=29401 RepID=A0A9W6L2E1_9PSEU|nr:hypothetical protein GCM10017577_09290 [Pseudonocardia halophobica]
MLSEVTFAEIADLVRREVERGYESEKQEGRRRLLGVVDGLAADEGDDVDARAVQGRTWRVAQIEVSGIGGISRLVPSPVTFLPVRGITVIRGLNGQGKTSLARALECALSGRRDLADEVSGELWNAALLTQGSAVGTVSVGLVSGSARLDVTVDFPRDGEAGIRAALDEGSGAEPVVLGSGWQRALAAARASYSYGALQSRLVESRALQGFLEELLLLGPAWEQVRAAVSDRAERATEAKRTVENALTAGKRREREIRERISAHGVVDPPPSILWPRVQAGLDADAWLRSLDLGAESNGSVRVSGDHEQRIADIRCALIDAEARLDLAEQALDAPGIAGAAHHIEQILAIDAIDDAVCPLCGAASAWRDHAREVVAGLRDRSEAAGLVMGALTDLRDWATAELEPLLASEITGGPEAELTAFREATAQGCHARSAAHACAGPLLAAVTSQPYRDWLETMRSWSQAAVAWRDELVTITRTCADVMRENMAAAADAGVWKKAQDTLDDLQLTLRQRRQDAVTRQMHAALTRMLPDAAVELSAIRHQGTIKQQRGVDVTLTIGGQEATLGMLSSGQRNALLLTPLTVLDGAAPFGFLVVDDPVHALDDTRVDLLAQEFSRLAGERQVIVLTHDPRLEEHLRARHADLTVVELYRDPVARTVSWTRHTEPWQSLLDDAREIRKSATTDGWAYTEPLMSVVAGLCRTAVDGAIRQATITRAVQRSEDVEQALTDLADALTTGARIKLVTASAGGKTELPALERARAGHLRFWNEGAHGQLDETVDLDAVLDVTEAACRELADHDWAQG